MATYRFPVLVWEDFAGAHTASLVDRDVTAVGATRAEALLQIKELLAWRYREEGWIEEPDFKEPSLIHFKVEVRPEYRVDKRVYPVEETIPLRVACVRGRQEGGLLVCAIPMFGFRFYYYDERGLRDLVRHYVGEGLKERTPRDLSRHLSPKSVLLEELVLHLHGAPRRREVAPDLVALRQVAEPVGDRRGRRQYGRAWERERELDDLVRRLEKERANVILLGEAGIGKSTLLAEAVRRIERLARAEADDAQDVRHRYWRTGGGRLVAGMRYLGEWQARCEAIVDELASIEGVLAVESLRDLLDAAGREAGTGIAAFLMPYLQRAELRMVVEATPEELDACRRALPGFADLFQVVRIPPFDRVRALTILGRMATTLERDEGVRAADGVAELVYRLFTRFVPYEHFPGRTVGFLRDLFDRAGLGGEKQVTTRQVIDEFVRRTGLPELFLRDDLPLEQGTVYATFAARVIGQPEACRAAASVVTTFKAGLNDPGRPVAVLLLCGPTGVGKTELARAISHYFFGHGERADRLVRLDMSEYGTHSSAERLVEKPDGGPSEFVKQIRQQPFSVVLLDEIEKAAPEVFDVLLSVFDEGRLLDPQGRVTSFRSAVIVMTSNIGSDRMQVTGFGGDTRPSYEAETMGFFRPEFYNRLDAVVPFEALDEAMIDGIARKELGEIAGREGLAKARLRLEWSERLVRRVAREGFDPRYGARPLQRKLDTLVVAPLAAFLLELRGLEDATIFVDLDESDRVVFSI